jgi:hypothetical protein
VIFGAPSVPLNGATTVILDGRNLNVPEDVWRMGTADAIAPAGAFYVRTSLFFLQLNGETGSVWFDDVSLTRIPEPSTALLAMLGGAAFYAIAASNSRLSSLTSR